MHWTAGFASCLTSHALSPPPVMCIVSPCPRTMSRLHLKAITIGRRLGPCQRAWRVFSRRDYGGASPCPHRCVTGPPGRDGDLLGGCNSRDKRSLTAPPKRPNFGDEPDCAPSGGAQRSARPTIKRARELGNTPARGLIGTQPCLRAARAPDVSRARCYDLGNSCPPPDKV